MSMYWLIRIEKHLADVNLPDIPKGVYDRGIYRNNDTQETNTSVRADNSKSVQH